MHNEGMSFMDKNKRDTIASIKSLAAEISVLGGNNFEISALLELVREVESSERSPEEALRQALAISERKQDDH